MISISSSSLYHDLSKPWTYEDHLAECTESGEKPMTAMEFLDLMMNPVEGTICSLRGMKVSG